MGFGLYVLGGDGLSHDLIVVIFGSTIAATLSFAEIAKRLSAADVSRGRLLKLRQAAGIIRKIKPQAALLCASTIFTVAIAFGLHENRLLLAKVILAEEKETKYTFDQALEKLSRPKESVSVLYDTPLAIPSMLVLDRRPADYILYCRPLLILDWAKKRGFLTEPLSKFAQDVFVRIHVSYDLSRPDLIMVCDDYCRDFITAENTWKRLLETYEIVANCRFNSGRWPPREYVGFNWNMNVLRRRMP